MSAAPTHPSQRRRMTGDAGNTEAELLVLALVTFALVMGGFFFARQFWS